MINRVCHIGNIGPFGADFCTDTSLEFKRLNLLFGHNGSGKTMLSNAMRLFADGVDAEELSNLLTANAGEPVNLEIEWDNKKLKAPKAQHSVLVFNANFTAEHVYDGSSPRIKRFKGGVVTTEQLKNPQIKKLEDSLRKVDETQRGVVEAQKLLQVRAETVYKALSNRWNKAIDAHRLPTGLNLSSKVPQNAPTQTLEVLEHALEEHFRSYKLSKQQEDRAADIATLSAPEGVKFEFAFDVAGFLGRKAVDTALRRTREKIEKYKDVSLAHGSVQQWFEDGFALLSASAEQRECPLCDSRLPNIDDIIRQYSEFYNDEFGALKQNLNAVVAALTDVAKSIDTARATCATVRTLVAKYKLSDKLGADNQAALVAFAPDTLDSATRELRKLVERKLANLDAVCSESEALAAAAYSKTVQEAAVAWEQVDKARSTACDLLTRANFDLTGAKATAADYFWRAFDESTTAPAAEVEGQPNPVGVAHSALEDYWQLKEREKALASETERITRERNTLLVQLRGESRYVNNFLKRLGVTNLEIKVGDKDDEDIEIIYSSGARKRGINYSLSEGEKTALAFAFFLSKVQHEIIDNANAKLEEYVAVIDDPISSLDENRLSATAMLIRSLFVGQVQQLFVLSHNLVFLKHFSSGLSSTDNLQRADYLLDAGRLSPLPKPLENFQTSYFYKLSKVRAFLDGDLAYETGKDFLPGYTRMILETFLAFKLCRLKHGSGNQQKFKSAGLDSLIGSVRGLNLSSFHSVGVITDTQTLVDCLESIKRQTDPESHGSVQDLTEFEYLSEPDLRTCCQNAIDIIAFLDRMHFDETAKLPTPAVPVADAGNVGTEQLQGEVVETPRAN